MQTQELLNTLATLSGCIDPLIRAEKKEAIEKIVEKMLSIVSQIS